MFFVTSNIWLLVSCIYCNHNEWMILQNMYEDGDDEMKKTIAKAWTDARSGKVADPMNKYG